MRLEGVGFTAAYAEQEGSLRSPRKVDLIVLWSEESCHLACGSATTRGREITRLHHCNGSNRVKSGLRFDSPSEGETSSQRKGLRVPTGREATREHFNAT